MPEYLSPAAYIEEQETLQPIEGVSTSTTGMIGVTVRGPIDGLPVLVTGFPEFRRVFGGYFDFGGAFAGLNMLPHAVAGFFTNGGKRLYIRRVIANPPPAAAHITARGGLVTRLLADAPGAQNHVRLATLRGIDNTRSLTFTQVKDGITTTSGPHTVSQYNRATNVVTLGTNLLHPFEARFTTVTSNIVRNNTFDILAADSGTWGNDIDVRPFHMSSARSPVVQILAPVASGQVELASAAGFYPGAWVEFDRGQNKVRRQVTGVNGRVITVTPPFALLTDLGAQAPATETLASVCEFGLTVTFEDVSEEFRGLTLANIPGRFYFDRIHNRSSLIDVTQPPVSGTDPLQFPSADDGLSMHPALGTNGAAPIDLDYVGVDGGPGNRTGLQSMIDIENVSLIAAPGITDQTVQQAMVDHCELMRYRVALLDPEPIASGAPTYLNDIQEQRSRFDTKYAALYCPRVVVTDPLTKTDIPVPPSGHVAGICARVDEERGVHKAPANEVIRGIVDIELVLNKGEQDILNPYPSNINVIRDFRHQGRAIRVWGARAITSETAWKYLNVRRLFNFVEASLDRGTQPYIFEPNDEHLWARVRQAISNFLGTVWRDGALFGSKEEEAFFVRCDRTTMTEDDIDNGRLIIIVGLAAVKPTEFLIIRIGQKSGLTTVEELL